MRISESEEAEASGVYDVLVVGAGPVGLASAVQLATRGWRVGVVERWPQAFPLPRAVVFDHEVARILASAGVSELPSLSEPAEDYVWRNGKGDVLLRLAFEDTSHSGWPVMSTFTQPRLEAALETHARTLPGVDFLRGWEAVDIDEDATSVRLMVAESVGDGPLLRDGIRRHRTLQAAYLIGCDGANSFVRSRMDTSVTDLGFQYDWLVLDVIPHDRDRVWSPRNLQVCDPARPTTAVSGGPGRRRWEFMRLPGESLAELNRPETAWKLLEPWDVHPGNATLERHTVYTFQARWADSWRSGRLLLAGDAAHQMPPFAGQGMCSGIRDTANLSWKLDLVMSGQADADLLDTYTVERSAHVQHAIQASMYFGRIICEPDPAAAEERDARIIAEQSDPDALLPTSPLTSGLLARDVTGAPAEPAGQFGPQGRVRHQGRTGLFDRAVGTGFILLATRDPREVLDEDALAWCERIGIHLLRVTDDQAAQGPADVVDLDGTYLRYLASTGQQALLLRPDYYVFGGAPDMADVPRLVATFRGPLSREDNVTRDAVPTDVRASVIDRS